MNRKDKKLIEKMALRSKELAYKIGEEMNANMVEIAKYCIEVSNNPANVPMAFHHFLSIIAKLAVHGAVIIETRYSDVDFLNQSIMNKVKEAIHEGVELENNYEFVMDFIRENKDD